MKFLAKENISKNTRSYSKGSISFSLFIQKNLWSKFLSLSAIVDMRNGIHSYRIEKHYNKKGL